jgi:hypothetical protein
MTSVFVPQDLEFMGPTREAISAITPHLVTLIAHDRAAFGGALACFGIAMFGCLRYARLAPAPWQALTIAGVVGFGTAIGVHPIGYLSFTHLGPPSWAVWCSPRVSYWRQMGANSVKFGTVRQEKRPR